MGGVEGLRFLCDEHVGIPVYRALKRVRLDIVHLLALGMGGTSDPAVFQYARDEGRILLTRNYKDFAPLVEKWAQAKVGFPGVLFIATSIPQADAGAHVRALKAWVEKAGEGVHWVENTYGWLHWIIRISRRDSLS